MNLGGINEKIKKFLDRLTKAFRRLLPDLPNIFSKSSMDELADRLLGKIPKEIRKPMLFGFGGLAVILLIMVISFIAASSGGPKKNSSAGIAAGPYIPPDELFIPAEPDFLPDFIPGREPRQSWSAEDARPYWRNPANQDIWREEVKSSVDKLLEGVP